MTYTCNRRIIYQQGAMNARAHLDAKGGMNDVTYFQNYSQLYNMDIIY